MSWSSRPSEAINEPFELTPNYLFTITAIFALVLGVIIVTVFSIAPDPSAPRGRWSGRWLDQAWFIFFLIHIPTTLLIDCQGIYPAHLIPRPLVKFLNWYLDYSRDPILIGARSGSREWDWIVTFLHLELFLQLPSFILGAIGLWRNDKRVYPLILLYAASTATTVVPTLYYIWTENATPPLTELDRFTLMATYAPFLAIPVAMVIDMTVKLMRLVSVAERAVLVTEERKTN